MPVVVMMAALDAEGCAQRWCWALPRLVGEYVVGTVVVPIMEAPRVCWRVLHCVKQ